MFSVEQVREILECVEVACAHDVKCYVAGGFLRDTMNNIKPKDVDIMVAPQNDIFDAFDLSLGLMRTEFHVVKELLEECQYMPDMQTRGVEGLITGEYNGVDVQFILYNKNLTQQQVTGDMDINLCQITMNSAGDIYETDNFVRGFADSVISLHHTYSEKRVKQRFDRMLAKYPTFSIEDPQ